MGLPNIVQELNSVITKTNDNITEINTIKSTYLPLRGGNIAGNIKFPADGIMCGTQTTDAEGNPLYQLSMGFDNHENLGGYILLRRGDSTAYNQAGMVALCASLPDGTRNYLFLNSDGTASINGKSVVCVESYNSGEIVYRKYSDGFIEQFGTAKVPQLSADTTSSTRITLPITFSTITYKVFTQFLVDAGNSWDLRTYATPRGTATFDVYFCSSRSLSSANGTISWYAAGY